MKKMEYIFSRKVLATISILIGLTLLNNGTALEGQGSHTLFTAEIRPDHPHAWVAPLDYPGRDEWQKPDEVVKSMNLEPGDIIADIGAGDGYFTKRFARAVSPGGQALGLDVVPSKVEQMKRDAERSGLKTYVALLINSEDPGLEPGSVDVVFLCNTYHHLHNRVEYFKRLSGSLKENGRVIIIDFYKKQLPVGPSSAGHKVSREVVLEEFQEAGYTLQQEKDFLPYQYYLEFGL